MADNNILASNLAQLGGQIASTFQNVALQNQYKNSLPAMQQVFQQSMTDFDSGRSGAGFARIMDVAMQNPNNPYIQNMAQMAFKAGQLASDDYFKKQQIDISRQKANSKGATIIPENFFGDGTETQGTTVGVPNTNQVIAENNSLTPEQQADFAKNATISSDQVGSLGPGKQIKDASFLNDYGIPAVSIVGPAIFTKQQRDSLTKTASSRGLSISQTLKDVKQNEDIAKAFDSDYSDLVQADKLLKSDSTTQDLLNQSNNNIFNIKVTQVPSATGGKDKTYEANVGNNKKVDITEDQYKAIVAIKGVAAGVKAYGGNLVSRESKEKTETTAPTQGGLLAVQPPPAAEIPAEAVELQKIVEQGSSEKAVETAKNVEKRIQDIDMQIKRLGSTTAAPQTRLQSEGNMPLRRKTPEEAQADIEKIAQLKSEKELLFVKTEKAYNTAKSEGRVFQSAEEAKSSKKKFPAGTIIYIGREPAKVK